MFYFSGGPNRSSSQQQTKRDNLPILAFNHGDIEFTERHGDRLRETLCLCVSVVLSFSSIVLRSRNRKRDFNSGINELNLSKQLYMETIVVQAANAEELKLIEEFLKKHKLKSRILTDDDKEDIVFGKLMEETDYKETIPTDAFIKKLRS